MTEKELGLAAIGLAPPDLQRLKAMMVMAITNSALSYPWHMSDVNAASVVIVAPDNAEGMALASSQGGDDGKIVAVLTGESDGVPAQYLRLPWPIRLEGLLAVLKVAERRLRKRLKSGKTTIKSPTPQSEHHLVRLAALIKHAATPSDIYWRIQGLSRSPLYIAAATGEYFLAESLTSLRRVDATVKLDFSPIAAGDMPVRDHVAKPLLMLRWFIGLQAGPLGLFPWLEAESTFRLRRFPDFQALHHEAIHRRIAAALTKPRSGVPAIAALADVDASVVSAFLNAADLCGYLHVEAGIASTSGPTSSANRAKRMLVQVFRKALGMDAAHA